MSQWRGLPVELDRRAELALMVALLLIAVVFRFHQPDAVPPGPSHDELRMMELAQLIVDGERPIHWKISYTPEPLFMYVLAGAMSVWSFTPFAARIVTRFAGLLLITLVHLLSRRLFGRRVALVGSGVLAVTWWPVFLSRVALRGITFPVAFVAAVYCLWQGLGLGGASGACRVGAVRWGWLVLGGALMGLTWYIFTAARGLCLLLPILLAYLGLVRFVPARKLWRIALVAMGVGALVAAPFVYEVEVHPGVPEERMEQLGGIIEALRAGNVTPLIGQTLATLGMLALSGDLNWRYNVAGRPAFGPILGTLSVLGLLLGVLRWRQPRHFLLVTWLFLGWAPSMLTPSAPSFMRAVGALPVAAMLAAIAAVQLVDWISARTGQRVGRLGLALVVLLLVLNGCVTFRDLFVNWPIQPAVREIYQASLTEALRHLDRSSLEGSVWISEPFPDDRHLLLAQRVLQRDEVRVRWFDADRALILPPAEGARRYLIADFARPDPALFARWMAQATVVLQGQSPAPTEGTAYQVLQAEGGAWVEQALASIVAGSTAFAGPGAQQAVSLPARFDEVATFVGYELADDHVVAGQELHLVLYWHTPGPIYRPLTSFAHLLDAHNSVVGQYDGFDVPAWEWEPEAVVAQVYRFPVAGDAQPGAYWLEIGLYDPVSMERVRIYDDGGAPLGDRLLLQQVVIE